MVTMRSRDVRMTQVGGSKSGLGGENPENREPSEKTERRPHIGPASPVSVWEQGQRGERRERRESPPASLPHSHKRGAQWGVHATRGDS
ncbi:hypothetical protein E2C01_002715 [Portunus trituberculatus]|uniref:Uncharacterized protein n=1 Tax=Portunus trituberculatus TaxID=210409 RepID=A0A5B7CKH0_PORTR|nr:hypothetical protein [Portunus trituberculatus]